MKNLLSAVYSVNNTHRHIVKPCKRDGCLLLLTLYPRWGVHVTVMVRLWPGSTLPLLGSTLKPSCCRDATLSQQNSPLCGRNTQTLRQSQQNDSHHFFHLEIWLRIKIRGNKKLTKALKAQSYLFILSIFRGSDWQRGSRPQRALCLLQSNFVLEMQHHNDVNVWRCPVVSCALCGWDCGAESLTLLLLQTQPTCSSLTAAVTAPELQLARSFSRTGMLPSSFSPASASEDNPVSLWSYDTVSSEEFALRTVACQLNLLLWHWSYF